MAQLPFFYNPERIISSEGVLNEDTSRHIVQVLRMSEGENLLLTDGKGSLDTAVITSANKKHTRVKIVSTAFDELKNQVSIAISPLKNANRFEWFIEKAVEIGVKKILPLKCKRTERAHFKHERIKQILISAMLQSRQAWLPELSEITDYNIAVTTCEIENKFIAHCDEMEKQLLSDAIKKTENEKIILIGPEGDFTREEIELALLHNFKSVSLGANRLRTETAGITACVLLNI